MANPERAPDPRYDDPLNPLPPAGSDPVDRRPDPANTQDPYIDNRVVMSERRSGSGVLIAAVVLVLAVIAYFVFAPGTSNAPGPAEQPAATEPATPAPAPDATAPAAPATPATPAPEATAPANPAEPATPAPENSTPEAAPANPAQPAPAEPAPAQ